MEDHLYPQKPLKITTTTTTSKITAEATTATTKTAAMSSEHIVTVPCGHIPQNDNHWEAWPTWELQVRRDSVSEIKVDSI